MSGSAHKAKLADYGVTLAAFNAVTVLGEGAPEQGYDCSHSTRALRYWPVRRIAIMTATGNLVVSPPLTDQPKEGVRALRGAKKGDPA